MSEQKQKEEGSLLSSASLLSVQDSKDKRDFRSHIIKLYLGKSQTAFFTIMWCLTVKHLELDSLHCILLLNTFYTFISFKTYNIFSKIQSLNQLINHVRETQSNIFLKSHGKPYIEKVRNTFCTVELTKEQLGLFQWVCERGGGRDFPASFLYLKSPQF